MRNRGKHLVWPLAPPGPPCWSGRACSLCRGPPKEPMGPGGAPREMGGALPLWFASRPPGLWMAPEIREATGWWIGMEPALLWCGAGG